MSSLPSWRILPPAGAPLTVKAIFSGLTSLASGKAVTDALRLGLTERFHMRHAQLADTGRAALSLALLAISRLHPERDEVLIPAYVSFSVPSAVVNAGFKVQLYDVNPNDLSPDYESMREAASERTLAIVICHQFGLPFDPAPAEALCRTCGAMLIDDAAQAMGGTIKGNYAGCLGDVGLFSLSRGKPLTAVDGGILLSNNNEIAQKINELTAEQSTHCGDASNIIKAFALLFLRRPVLYRIPASLPWLNIGASIFDPSFQRAPMSRFRAGLALSALTLLDAANAARAAKAKRYDQELAHIPFLRAIPPQAESKSIYLRFPVLPRPEGIEPLHALMRAQNGYSARKLGISSGFPLPLNAVPTLQPHLAQSKQLFPGARLLAENLITLPTHDQVRQKDITNIVHFLASASKRNNHAPGRTTR